MRPRCRSRSRCRHVMWLTVSTRSGRWSDLLLSFLTFLGNHDAGDNDDQQQQEQQNHDNDNDDDPNRKRRFFFSFSLGLLAALNQPVDFGMLREKSLYFFKLRNR